MQRRRLLKASGTLAIGLVAGCAGAAKTGPSERPPEPPEDESESGEAEPLSVTSFDYGSNEAGRLVVAATVANDDDREREATLRVTVTVDDRAEHVEERAAIPAGDEHEFSMAFDLRMAEFQDGGDLEFTLE